MNKERGRNRERGIMGKGKSKGRRGRGGGEGGMEPLFENHVISIITK